VAHGLRRGSRGSTVGDLQAAASRAERAVSGSARLPRDVSRSIGQHSRRGGPAAVCRGGVSELSARPCIEQADVTRRTLRHLGPPTDLPEATQARAHRASTIATRAATTLSAGSRSTPAGRANHRLPTRVDGRSTVAETAARAGGDAPPRSGQVPACNPDVPRDNQPGVRAGRRAVSVSEWDVASGGCDRRHHVHRAGGRAAGPRDLQEQPFHSRY
jgi:hypothetical protein